MFFFFGWSGIYRHGFLGWSYGVLEVDDDFDHLMAILLSLVIGLGKKIDEVL